MKNKMFNMLLCVTVTVALLTGCGSKAPTEPAAPAATAEESVQEAEDKASSAEEVIEVDAIVPETEAETIEAETIEAETTEAETADVEETASTDTAADGAVEKMSYQPGTWKGTTYTNEQLGFTITLPKTYTILTGKTLQNAMGQATDVVLEKSDLKNYDMSAVVYDFMGLSTDQKTNLIFGAEDNRFELDSEGYGAELLKSFDMMGVPYAQFADPETVMIGNLDFYEVDLMLDYSEMTGIEENYVGQSYLIHAEEDVVYYFTITFTEESMEEIAGILQTLQPIE